MNVICGAGCKKEFDWNDKDIFFIPSGFGLGTGSNMSFYCRDCLKHQYPYLNLKKNSLTPLV